MFCVLLSTGQTRNLSLAVVDAALTNNLHLSSGPFQNGVFILLSFPTQSTATNVALHFGTELFLKPRSGKRKEDFFCLFLFSFFF